MHALTMTRHAAGRLIDPPVSPAEPDPTDLSVAQGRAALDRETDRLFGPRPETRTPRIMATLSSDVGATDIERYLIAGADAVRINSTQGDAKVWRRLLDDVGAASRATGKPCRRFVDLGGPKIRIAGLRSKGRDRRAIRLQIGDRLELARAEQDAPDHAKTAWATLPEVFDALEVGEGVHFDDGKIAAEVERVHKRVATLRVTHTRPGGQKLRLRKGVNLPGASIDLPALSASDIETVGSLAGRVDAFCLSFAHRPEDVRSLLRELNRAGAEDAGVVVKVETRAGFENLPSMLLALMHAPIRGVMIARGDLAVEMGFQRLAEVQEEVMWVCEAAHTPVIWATEVLPTLTKTGAMSRAEVTDAAMAQRAECVMLNKGPMVAEAIRSLSDILERMQSHQRKKMAVLRALHVGRFAGDRAC